MTGQTLLDMMELLDQELQLQPGEVNVTRGLLALNIAQDYFESVAASYGKILGDQTGTLSTAAATETTAFPTGVLRVDRLQLLGENSLPKWELRPIKRTGGHFGSGTWPLNVLLNTSTGEPTRYWTNGRNIYWSPLPSGVSTVRWYGFKQADDITVGVTFAYPDIVALPLAAFAVRLYKSGVDDAPGDAASLAGDAFQQVLDTLSGFDRDGATGLEYTRVHQE